MDRLAGEGSCSKSRKNSHAEHFNKTEYKCNRRVHMKKQFEGKSNKLSPLEMQYLLRLVMKDLRINAGVKHILDGLHNSAYEAFQNCRDLAEIVERQKNQFGDVSSVVEVGIRLGTPVLPMLAEPCKSVEQAMKRCSNGMFAEIKYDGERVQVHKIGSAYSYYSRSLKPVQHHKISHLEEFIPKAFPEGLDLIIDGEVLLVDNATGKPLPFGTLGIHKKEKFKDASVCLFVFDILLYNNEDLMSRSISHRKKLLESQMTEIKNRVMLSNYRLIHNGVRDNDTLKTMIWKAIDEGLEGLVLKDIESIYEPGKRHWLKVKKDYLEDGKMADTADLIVLGAYFGTGNKDYLEISLILRRISSASPVLVLTTYMLPLGGMMSVFLMGVYDSETKSYRTVTKCGNGHSDDTLDVINKELENQVIRIDGDYDRLPTWLRCSRSLVPDFVVVDPEKAPVWEITGDRLKKRFCGTVIRIDGDYDRLPTWLRCSRSLVPDFVVVDPEKAPVWEITGAEFSRSDKHTAAGISIRFPRVTRIRDDKDWKTATNLSELEVALHKLYDCSKSKSDIDHSFEDETPLYVKNEGHQSESENTKKLDETLSNPDVECTTSNGRKRDAEDDESIMPEKKKPKKEQDEEQCPEGKTPCKYGAECYRKSTDHKAEYWHPPKN
ncbi:ATP-dependent DNA ligase domain protein [Dictyocaulus viviparus]|uniref:DNA ligase n=1 Tax=Dictyocaulus viviparus TaxID=29172 RepID=A0A0D8XDX8_DICVI|nr:ATP-dependent DNA ligase domain protein [Dictyocaulus viviparus]